MVPFLLMWLWITGSGVSQVDLAQGVAVRRGLDHLVGSHIPVPGNPSREDNIGFAGEPDLLAQHPLQWQDPNFDDVLRLMLRRVTVCPSDYDRDGVQDVNVDPPQFIQDVLLMAPYADWNFDTIFDGATPGGLDNNQFFRPFQVMTCP